MKNKKDTLNEFYRLSGVKPLIDESEIVENEDKLSPKEQQVLKDIMSEMYSLNEVDFNSVLDKVKSYAKKGMLTAGIMAALLATPGITNAQSDAIKDIANTSQVDSGKVDTDSIKTVFFKTSAQDRALMASIISQDIELFELTEIPISDDKVEELGLSSINTYIAKYGGTSEQNAKFIEFISNNKDLFKISNNGVQLDVKALHDKVNPSDSNHWYTTRVDDMNSYFINTSGNALANYN